MNKNEQRPVFLNLFRIRFPATAVASFGHRMAGVLLFVLLPVLIYTIELSLRSPEGFETVRQWLQGWPVRLLLWLAAWAGLHHLFAGLRFLLIDVDVGVAWEAARWGAWLVTVGGFAGAVLIVLGAAAG